MYDVTSFRIMNLKVSFSFTNNVFITVIIWEAHANGDQLSLIKTGLSRKLRPAKKTKSYRATRVCHSTFVPKIQNSSPELPGHPQALCANITRGDIVGEELKLKQDGVQNNPYLIYPKCCKARVCLTDHRWTVTDGYSEYTLVRYSVNYFDTHWSKNQFRNMHSVHWSNLQCHSELLLCKKACNILCIVFWHLSVKLIKRNFIE